MDKKVSFNINVCSKCKHFDMGGSDFHILVCRISLFPYIMGYYKINEKKNTINVESLFNLPEKCPYTLEHIMQNEKMTEVSGKEQNNEPKP